MRVHHLQHVPFETLGSMESHLRERGHRLSATHLYRGDPLPGTDDFDWLVVLGGPMGVYDEDRYPWLVPERALIRAAVESGRLVLGICLGAQLIASALGARVERGPHREIGWFPVARAPEAASSPVAGVLPLSFNAFHWHGDTFDIPPGAIPVGSSEAFVNQGFVLPNRVLALQFHLETTVAAASALVEHCSDELDGTRFVQTGVEMLDQRSDFDGINARMHSLLDALEKQAG